MRQHVVLVFRVLFALQLFQLRFQHLDFLLQILGVVLFAFAVPFLHRPLVPTRDLRRFLRAFVVFVVVVVPEISLNAVRFHLVEPIREPVRAHVKAENTERFRNQGVVEWDGKPIKSHQVVHQVTVVVRVVLARGRTASGLQKNSGFPAKGHARGHRREGVARGRAKGHGAKNNGVRGRKVALYFFPSARLRGFKIVF